MINSTQDASSSNVLVTSTLATALPSPLSPSSSILLKNLPPSNTTRNNNGTSVEPHGAGTGSPPSPKVQSSSNYTSSQHLGKIIGPAIGIPLALLALTLLVFCIYRQRKRRRPAPSGFFPYPKNREELHGSDPLSELEGSIPHSTPMTTASQARFESPSEVGAGLSHSSQRSSRTRSSTMSQMSRYRWEPAKPIHELPGDHMWRPQEQWPISELPEKTAEML